ncbi:MAG: CsbD family protein [Lyngbya sp.]|nr:CsbD family protein [Lyngbya sp.]
MQLARKFVLKFCVFVSLVLFCSGVLTTSFFPAQALSLNSSSSILATNSSMVDNVLGGGTTNTIEGQARQKMGAAQQTMKEAQAKAEGTLKQAQGKAQENVGDIQRQSREAQSDLDRASDNVVDAVKDFFGQSNQ